MAKTTVLSKFLPLYIASTGELPNFGRVLNCIIFSATYDQAVDLLKDIDQLGRTVMYYSRQYS